MTDPLLQRLADEADIRRLTARYSDAVALLDPVGAAAVYAADGRVIIGEHELKGRPAIEAGMRDTFAQFALLRLVEHGGLIEVDGDRASARWSTLELTVRSGADMLNVILGRYDDELLRLPDGWRFGRRRFTLAGRMQIGLDKLQTHPEFLAGLGASLDP